MLSQSNRNYLPVRLALTALAVASPLLVEAVPLSAYGPMTDFGNTLESLKNSAIHARASLPLLYLNAAMPVSEDQFSDIEDRMWAGDILLIDGTESEPQTVQAISASLGGVGLYGHVIMMYKPAFASAQFKQIVSANAVGREPPNSDTTGKLADETLALHDRWSRQLQYKTSQQRFSPSEWRPETTVQIELREINLPCLVGNQLEGTHSEPTYWTGGLIDACDHRASFSLNYMVDFIRSESSVQGTADAKYVRFTVNPESSGGAGWHLVDKPTHRHTWFQSWANRTTWFGPVADYYSMEIHALDEDIRLSHSIPASSPKHSKVKAKDTIKVGVPVRVGFSPRPAAPQPQEAFPEPPPGDDQESPEALPQRPPDNHRERDIPQTGMRAMAIGYPAADVWHSDEQNQQKPNTVTIRPSLQQGTMPILVEQGSFYDAEESITSNSEPASDDDSSIRFDISLLYDKPKSHLSPSAKHTNQPAHRHLSTVPAGSYYSSRSVIYFNQEYVIQNLSKSYKTDSAIWLWSREFSKYGGEWRNHEKCYLACTDWFFSDAAFSANAYSHFTPGFSATFKVAADKTGHSSFKLVSTVNPVALAGHIRYQVLFQDYSLWDQKGKKHSIEQWFRVNWDSPAFSKLPTITVEAFKQDSTSGLCLTVLEKNTAEGAPVNMYKCQPHLNQYWQYDTKQQLHSLVAPDRCLTAENNNTLSVRPCSNINQQKWQWQKNRLINLNLSYLTIKNGQATITKDTSKSNNISEWYSFLIRTPLNNTFILDN